MAKITDKIIDKMPLAVKYPFFVKPKIITPKKIIACFVKK